MKEIVLNKPHNLTTRKKNVVNDKCISRLLAWLKFSHWFSTAPPQNDHIFVRIEFNMNNVNYKKGGFNTQSLPECKIHGGDSKLLRRRETY